MRIPDYLSFSRLLLSPVYFTVFFLYDWTGRYLAVSLLGSWVIFLLIELSDLLDGYVARKIGSASELGKILDPFADSISRLTYFICFAGKGIMPLWVLLLVVYRDLGVSFIRLLANRRGVTMGARLSGKIKAWVYALAGVFGMVLVTWDSLLNSSRILSIFQTVTYVMFLLCGCVALFSLVDYAQTLVTARSKGSL